MLIEIGLFVIVAILVWYYTTKLPDSYPATPPIRLPIIGHGLYMLGYKNTQEAFNHLCEKYGKDGMMAVHLGPIKWVFLYELDLVKEAYKKEEINYRWRTEFVHKLIAEQRGGTGTEGIIFSHEKTWTEQRRFTLRTLREFGFGKFGMETIIIQEVEEFSKYLGEETRLVGQNEGLEVTNLFNVSILNALWKIISGVRYDYRDPQLVDLTRKVNEAMMTFGPRFSITFLMPWLRKFGVDQIFKENTERLQTIRRFILKTIEEHQETFVPGESRDFIDVYLTEIENDKDPNSSFYKEKGIENLVQTLADLFFAGSETTSSTLSWATLYLMQNPEVQVKVREEIFRVIGKERQPSLEDRTKMPYTEATIQEIQRMGNIAPFGLPHSTFKESITLNGKVIPRFHTVLTNMAGIMKNDDGWPEAKKFKPERHLTRDNKLIHDERIIPFLVGKRQCPGESLARAEIFLYLTGLLQKYEFLSMDPLKPPPSDFINGLTAVPKPFKARIKRVD